MAAEPSLPGMVPEPRDHTGDIRYVFQEGDYSSPQAADLDRAKARSLVGGVRSRTVRSRRNCEVPPRRLVAAAWVLPPTGIGTILGRRA